MHEEYNPIHKLEIRLNDLSAVVNLNDQRVKQQIEGMEEDIKEAKEREKLYVRLDSFDFYSRAFWILATATGSMLVGSIFFALTSKAGGT